MELLGKVKALKKIVYIYIFNPFVAMVTMLFRPDLVLIFEM